MTAPRLSITVPLLSKYFSVVKDLRTYLSEILEFPSDPDYCSTFEPKSSDGPLYHALVHTCYVAFNAASRERTTQPRFTVFPPMVDMREVLDKAQEKMFRSKQPKNMLTAGYRRAFKDGDRGKQGMTRVGITNFFVNTIVTALQSPEWDFLLQRIGEDAMLHLLTETHIFVSLPNDCLCQMTGEPIIHMVPMNSQATEHTQQESSIRRGGPEKRPLPFPDDDAQEHFAKRRKVDPPRKKRNLGSICGHSPVEITFARARIFYCRPGHVPQSNQIIVGLQEKHILNMISPAYRRQPKVHPSEFVDPDPKNQAEQARHLAKYIFSRQYCLTNPFFGARSKAALQTLPDYSDKEFEIKNKGTCKTPKRLKHVLPLLDKMIWMHGKCGYKPLRDKVCPSKLKVPENKKLDSTIILELMSEQSSLLCTQGNVLDDSSTSIMPFGMTQAERQAKSKPRFAEFVCSVEEVFRYVALITEVVIPKAFWGSKTNLIVILQYVKEFIQCRRFENLTLHHILQGFSTSQCDWLIPPGMIGQGRVSVSDALKRRELLEEFLFWYFDSFVSSLLKTNFYITESSAFRNRVLYFRQDDWEALCAPLIERLTTGTFVRIPQPEAEELLRQRRLGFSFVRLLPKETGVRPIVNLRRRKTVQKGPYSSEQSINQILQAAFQILSFEKRNQPEQLGASVFGPDDIYLKLRDFKSRLHRNPDGSFPRLYFVKVDVQACFDTIEQGKLLDILRELISEDVYMTQRYGKVGMATGRIQRTYVKRAIPDDDHPHFLRYASDLAKALRHVILVDQVVYPMSEKQEILHLLEEHITENIVKIGQGFYRQMVGIPQGSILSALLCSFFYGDLEKRYAAFKDDSNSVLLRLIDDYLFITTNRPQAGQFLDMMNRGHPEYGCFISKEKTLTSFDYDAQIMNVTDPKQRSFPWCGYLIDMENLSISVDYTRYTGTSLTDTLSVVRGRRPGAAFTYKMIWLAKARNHPIYVDSTLNSNHVVYLNVYQNFLLCAIKMHCYLRELGAGTKNNPRFIHDTVQKIITYSYSSLKSRIIRRRESCQVNPPNVKLQKMAVHWLGSHAFYTVLIRKPQRYVSLLRSLRFELSRPCGRRYKKQFGRLIREGQADILHLLF